MCTRYLNFAGIRKVTVWSLLGFQIFTAVRIKIAVFWAAATYSVAVMLEAVGISETSISFYETMHRNAPEDRCIFCCWYSFLRVRPPVF
jgi:hypothetical protein